VVKAGDPKEGSAKRDQTKTHGNAVVKKKEKKGAAAVRHKKILDSFREKAKRRKEKMLIQAKKRTQLRMENTLGRSGS